MVVEIKRKYSEKKKKELIEKVRNEAGRRKPSLKDVFGIYKDDIDGLAFQKKVRNEWD
jgi:hypothetical protein